MGVSSGEDAQSGGRDGDLASELRGYFRDCAAVRCGVGVDCGGEVRQDLVQDMLKRTGAYQLRTLGLKAIKFDFLASL